MPTHQPPRSPAQWSELLTTHDRAAEVDAVIASVEPIGQGPLLPLERQTRKALLQRLRQLAREALESAGMPRYQLESVLDNPVLPAEMGLEGRGKIREAAALFALEHDELEHEFQEAALITFTKAMLRLKLAHTLDQSDDSRARSQLCLQILQDAANWMADQPDLPGITHESIRQLGFRMQEWLAPRLERCNQPLMAAEAFRKAATMATDADEKVRTITRAALVLERADDKSEALRTLLRVREDLPRVSGETRRTWNMTEESLRTSLGARVSMNPDSPASSALNGMMETWLASDRHPDEAQISALKTLLRSTSERAHQNDPEGKLVSLISILKLSLNHEHPDIPWEETLKQARILNAELRSPVLHMELRWLELRRLAITDPAAALDEHDLLVRDCNTSYSDSERLQHLGHLGEILARLIADTDKTHEDQATLASRIEVLCREVEQTYRHLLASQPTPAERRRVREMHQYAIEAALFVAAVFSERYAADDPAYRAALEASWNLLLGSRHPTLATTARNPVDAVKDQGLLAHEARFTHALNLGWNTQRDGNPEHWQPLLEALYEYELTNPTPHGNVDHITGMTTGNGVHIAQFRIREMLADRPMMLFLRCGDSFSIRIVDQVEPQLESLRQWQVESFSGLTPDARIAIDSVNTLLNLSAPELANTTGNWHLYLEAELSDLALDCLISDAVGKLDFLPTGMVLAHSGRDSLIQISRGMLALVNIPSGPAFAPLPGSSREWRRIQQEVAGFSCPAYTLEGPAANARNLDNALREHQPAILHLACHGVSNMRYPEACALVLAPQPENPDHFLLTFRNIEKLPLESVELVVLSACSSSLGPRSRSAGLEGLVWAFLDAGVPAVLASRYPVDDASTTELMVAFYAELPVHPPIAALARARERCRKNGLSEAALAAWGIWT